MLMKRFFRYSLQISQRLFLSMNSFYWRVGFVLVELGTAIAIEKFSFSVDIIIRVSVFWPKNRERRIKTQVLIRRTKLKTIQKNWFDGN